MEDLWWICGGSVVDHPWQRIPWQVHSFLVEEEDIADEGGCFNADGSGSVADHMASAFLVEEEDALQMKVDVIQCRWQRIIHGGGFNGKCILCGLVEEEDALQMEVDVLQCRWQRSIHGGGSHGKCILGGRRGCIADEGGDVSLQMMCVAHRQFLRQLRRLIGKCGWHVQFDEPFFIARCHTR